MKNESLFFWIGELTCLDFVNTERMKQGERVDLLPDNSTALDWLVQAKLVTREESLSLERDWQQHPEEAALALTEIRQLRSVIRHLADEIFDTGTVSLETLAALNHYVRQRSGHHQIEKQAEGSFAERFIEGSPHLTVPVLLGRLAQTASDMLCHADLSLIHRCENPNCILYFYDTTKNHTRRWCSMSGCGNRAKAAAHYQRKRQTHNPV